MQRRNKSDGEAHQALEGLVHFKGISHLDLWLRDFSFPSWSSTVCRKVPFVLPGWVWCSESPAVAGLANVRKSEYSHQQRGCLLSRLCPASCLLGNICTKDATSATGKSAGKTQLFSRIFTAQNIFRTRCLPQQAQLDETK